MRTLLFPRPHWPNCEMSSTAFINAVLAGGLAGTAVDTLFFPIDTLKTRAQSHAGFFPSGGFSGVYRGLGSAVIGSAPGGLSLLKLQPTR